MPEEQILMPELGESVHEGTVNRWLKQVGDEVKEDEPIVEIMTDKVNTELQAPASGILVEILIPEGEDVEVFKAMGIIEKDPAVAKERLAGAGSSNEKKDSTAKAPAKEPAQKAPEPRSTTDSDSRKFYTPVVRSMAKEHGLSDRDLESINGSGQGGRVTKKDIEAFLENRPSSKDAPVAAGPSSSDSLASLNSGKSISSGETQTTKLSGMRKMIADAMTRSSQVPVVSTLIEVDVTRMVEFRTRNKESFEDMYGVRLTYTPFFIKAVAETLIENPTVNSSLSDSYELTTHGGVHMGVAVSLGPTGEDGLIVPVIRDCHTKSLVDIAKDLTVIAKKARSNALGVDDVKGATFTLTNPGSYGAVLGTPMINAPQAGILGTYTIKKIPVIINDMIAVRSVMNLVLTYDHRVIDGALAGKFLQSLKKTLEDFDFFK